MNTSNSSLIAGLVSGICAVGSIYEYPNIHLRYVKRDNTSDLEKMKSDITKISNDFSKAKQSFDKELMIKNA